MRHIFMTISAMLVISGAWPACAKDRAFDSFPTSAWLSAPGPNRENWSRESLLASLPTSEQLQQRDRTSITAHLGMPGSSAELYSPGKGRHARIDNYRLSAKSDRSLRINYDGEDRFENYAVDDSSCGCPMCSHAASDPRAMVPMDDLLRTVLNATDGAGATTKGKVDRLLGHTGQPYAATQQIGGRAWTGYGEIWPIAGAGERFFIASGELTVRDRETRQDVELPITSFSVLTIGPDCRS